MASLEGVQPATIGQNTDNTRLLIAKCNSLNARNIVVNGKENKNKVRDEIHEHLRQTLRNKNWTTYGKYPIVACTRDDITVGEHISKVQELFNNEVIWGEQYVGNDKEWTITNHPEFQWVLTKILNEEPSSKDMNLQKLFSEDTDEN